jgi:hypothetical protein
VPTVVNAMSFRVGNYAPDYTPYSWEVRGWTSATGWVLLTYIQGYTSSYWSPGKVAGFGISNNDPYDKYSIRIVSIHEGITPGVVILDEIEMRNTLDVGHFNAVAQSSSTAFLSMGNDELLASSVISTGAVAGELIFGLVEMISATRVVNTVTIGQMFMGLSEILEGTSISVVDVNNEVDCMALRMRLRVTGEISTKGGIFVT